MADLTEKQFELGGVVFGLDAPLHLADGGFKPGGLNWRTQDGQPPEGDSTDFGRDFLTPELWGFELFTIADTEKQAYDDVATLASQWRAPGVRDTPQAVMPLRYCLRGETRVVYGRPGRWTPTYTNLSMNGNIPVTCDFRRADTLHYGDIENSVTVDMAPSTTTGFGDPLMDPLMSIGDAPPVQDEILIEGDHATPIIVEFSGGGPAVGGELTAPKLEAVGHWTAAWDGTLAYDQQVILDPRPWRRSVTYGSGGSAAGKLNRRTVLSELVLPPGRHSLIFTAAASLGATTATVRWRDAYSSL